MALSSDKTLLITRPSHDVVTSYLHYWSRNVVEQAESKGMKVLDLPDHKAVPKEFDGRLKKMKPNLVILNGHGNSHEVCGHDNVALLHADSPAKVKNTVVYARSCDSASVLGEICVQNGTRAYIGYKEKFWLCWDQGKAHHPQEDKIAAYVLEPSNQIISSLLKGRSASEAWEKSQKVSDRMVRKLMSSDAPDGSNGILTFVLWNKINQVCLGQQDAVI